MIQKAIIVSKSTDGTGRYKVRIPVIHGLSTTPNCTRDRELPFATVCGIAGMQNTLNVDDVVFVAFENGEFDTPVILGQLMVNGEAAVINNSSKRTLETNISSQSLTISTRANLPSDTTIGEITSFELSTLAGASKNIQAQINEINDNLPQS